MQCFRFASLVFFFFRVVLFCGQTTWRVIGLTLVLRAVWARPRVEAPNAPPFELLNRGYAATVLPEAECTAAPWSALALVIINVA